MHFLITYLRLPIAVLTYYSLPVSFHLDGTVAEGFCGVYSGQTLSCLALRTFKDSNGIEHPRGCVMILKTSSTIPGAYERVGLMVETNLMNQQEMRQFFSDTGAEWRTMKIV